MTPRESRRRLTADQVSFWMICVWFTNPAVSSAIGFWAGLALIGIWFASCDGERLWHTLFEFWPVAIWLALISTIAVLGHWPLELAPLQYVLGSGLFFFGGFAYRYYAIGQKDDVLARAAGLCLASFTLGSLWSIRVLHDHPFASRILATGSQQASVYAASGVGGFGHAYAAPLVLATLVGLAARLPRQSFRLRLLAYVQWIAVFAFVVLSQYTIALILSVVGSVLLVLGGASVKRLTVLTLALSLAILASIRRLADLLAFQATRMPSLTGERLAQVASLLSGDGSSELAEARLELIRKSWVLFRQNPVFGQALAPSPEPLGGHSGWADLLAGFGLIIALFFMLPLLATCSRQYLGFGDGRHRSVMYLSFLMAITIGIVNPIVYVKEIGFALMFIVPAANHISTHRVPVRSPSLVPSAPRHRFGHGREASQ